MRPSQNGRGALTAGPIALVGGDEFRAGCEGMDRGILEATHVPHPTLLVIPTAAASENPSRAASNGVAYFSSLGANASPLMVLDAAHASDDQLLAPIDTADVIYLTGGNPAHLLETLSGSVLLNKIRQALDRGAILAGSSAGAMVMGSWVQFKGWRKALGIVPGVAVLPHHESTDPEAVAKELADTAPSDVAVLGIDGKTCCFGGANGWKVLGAGGVTAYQGCGWRRFSSGEALTLDATNPGTRP